MSKRFSEIRNIGGRRRALCSVAAAVGILAASLSPVLADSGSFQADPDLEIGVNYRTWTSTLGDTEARLSQFVLPVFFRSNLRKNVDFSYLFNAASSELSASVAGDSRLSGVTDGKMALGYISSDQRFSAGLGFRVPTGESKLSPEEEEVALALNDRVLGFRVKRYGEGLDVELRGGYATSPNARLALAAGVSYVAKGEFTFLSVDEDREATYEPGDEFGLTGKLRTRALAREWTAGVHMATFSVDRRDGRKEIDEGTQVGVLVTMREEHLIGIAELMAEGVWKGDTKVLSAEGFIPVRDVGGSILRLRGDFHGQPGRRSRLGGHVGASWYGENQTGTGDGFVFELGASYRRSLGRWLTAEAGYTWLTGNAEDGTVDLRGHDVLLVLGVGGGGR
jgi:hypothetical protein